MKLKSPGRWSLRVRFTVLVLLELILVSGISLIVAGLLDYWFQWEWHFSLGIWLFIVSVLVGAGVSVFVSEMMFKPIKRLEKAMRIVASGNFDVQLNGEKESAEVQEIYENFNLMTEELAATEILQTDFVSNVSHEFKTPISAIEGYATLLQAAERATPQEQAQYVEKILTNTRRLSNLVGTILLLSKVDNQAIQDQPVTYRLDEQVRQSVVLLEPEWSKKNIEFDLDMESIGYTGNESLMMHVWNNLIGNAIKFSPEEGLINIKLMQKKNRIEFVIEDCGPGIKEEAQKHIFDKFYQSDSSHKGEGNGLGLALVKQILKTSNGSIFVENRAEGGCRFTLVLAVEAEG
ncbi:MAG: HAMP domain-containing histidine kinase [Firmicutes bacterium]|nr:HAMP domain-containing histidine kinase [Bacillota bacterium]